MNFKTELQNKIHNAESIVYKYLPVADGFQKTILEAMNYSVMAGGKRLRPIFIRETYEMFGGSGEVVEPFMAAIEFLHTASLVHDDLPAMDNDEYRRGKKTTHAVYGEAMGILAGDALLNYTYETALKALDIESTPNVFSAIRILAKNAGIYGMIGGQTVDLESENKIISPETLEFIHKNKTGALIEASMLIGATLAGASEEEKSRISRVAFDIGLAFQIQDDILDITGSQEELGKPIGSDEELNKSTYVSIHGLEKAKSDVVFYTQRALDELKGFKNKNQFLIDLVEMLITRKN